MMFVAWVHFPLTLTLTAVFKIYLVKTAVQLQARRRVAFGFFSIVTTRNLLLTPIYTSLTLRRRFTKTMNTESPENWRLKCVKKKRIIWHNLHVH